MTTSTPRHSISPTSLDKGKGKAVRPDNGGEDHVAQATPDFHEPDPEDDMDDDEWELNYERERLRRIQANQALLSSLGISAATTKIDSSSTATPHTTDFSPSARKKRQKRKGAVYDRSGYIISLPEGDERHTMVCVEIPSDRGLSKRIAAGEYTDCRHWAKSEDRRWRFGFGRGGELGSDEPEEIGGVTSSFRWRRWGGLHRELRKEMRKRGLMNEVDQRGQREEVKTGDQEVSAYSLIPGEACHQCRRKSEKAKMTCRNVDPVCRAKFCETCCKRYSYFDFDPESRSFICPLCKDCCNCSNCIRKRNLAHLLGPVGKKGSRVKSLTHTIKAAGGEGMTVQAWLEKAVEDKIGLPFDRIRLVDQATDIITPTLPDPEPIQESKPVKAPKKSKGRPKGIKTKAKKGKNGQEGQQEGEVDIQSTEKKKSLVIKFKIPSMNVPPEMKEYDSDGDTVGNWTDDERDGSASSLTPLSASPPPIQPPRLRFPPRPSTGTIDAADIFGTAQLPPQPLSISATYGPSSQTPLTSDAGQNAGNVPPVTDYQERSKTASPPNLVATLQQAASPATSDASEGRKRRKPPPKANILRAPKHARLSLNTSDTQPIAEPPREEIKKASDLPATDKPEHQPAQSFSYNGFTLPSDLPADFTMPNHLPHSHNSGKNMMYISSPPPSYSASSRPMPVPRASSLSTGTENRTEKNGPNGHVEQMGPIAPVPTQPDGLGMLSLAAAEARNSPSLEQQKIYTQYRAGWYSMAQGLSTDQRLSPASVPLPLPSMLGGSEIPGMKVGGVPRKMMVNRRYHPDCY